MPSSPPNQLLPPPIRSHNSLFPPTHFPSHRRRLLPRRPNTSSTNARQSTVSSFLGSVDVIASTSVNHVRNPASRCAFSHPAADSRNATGVRGVVAIRRHRFTRPPTQISIPLCGNRTRMRPNLSPVAHRSSATKTGSFSKNTPNTSRNHHNVAFDQFLTRARRHDRRRYRLTINRFDIIPPSINFSQRQTTTHDALLALHSARYTGPDKPLPGQLAALSKPRSHYLHAWQQRLQELARTGRHEIP